MTDFSNLDPDEQRAFISEAAGRLGVAEDIVEKDYWVTWVLRELFSNSATKEHLLFKGGTSLSKVYGIIRRFSEDIDLGVKPATLDVLEHELDQAASRTKRIKQFVELQAKCGRFVVQTVKPNLEAQLTRLLGNGREWLSFDQRNPQQPILRFAYPSATPAGNAYIPKVIKLEFGSLTQQQPLHRRTISSMLDEALDTEFVRNAPVIAMQVARTFWEKATILHECAHRPIGKPLPNRYARHYSDFVQLWGHPEGQQAAANLAMLFEVSRHKQLYFRTGTSHFELAVPGTLKLSPPDHVTADLRQDYKSMRAMFFDEPPSLESLLLVIAAAETAINAGAERQ